MVDGSAMWGNRDKGKEGLSRIINQDIRRQHDARTSSRYLIKRHGSVAYIPGMLKIEPDPTQAQFSWCIRKDQRRMDISLLLFQHLPDTASSSHSSCSKTVLIAWSAGIEW